MAIPVNQRGSAILKVAREILQGGLEACHEEVCRAQDDSEKASSVRATIDSVDAFVDQIRSEFSFRSPIHQWDELEPPDVCWGEINKIQTMVYVFDDYYSQGGRPEGDLDPSTSSDNSPPDSVIKEVWIGLLKLQAFLNRLFYLYDSSSGDSTHARVPYGTGYSPSHFLVFGAAVHHRIVGKFIGEYSYVRKLLLNNPPREEICLGVQTNYGWQVVAKRALRSPPLACSPGSLTILEREDVVFFVPVHNEGLLKYKQFSDLFMVGSLQLFDLELFDITLGRGAPAHLNNCVIGAPMHRNNDSEGALQFREVFSSLAIYRLTHSDGTQVMFPGPRDKIMHGDLIFTAGRIMKEGEILVDFNPRANLSDEILKRLLDESEFRAHVEHYNSKNRDHPEKKVILSGNGACREDR